MKKIVLLLLVLFSMQNYASSINASSFGYNPTNATAAIIAAIESQNDTIVVDLQSGDWNVGPLFFYEIQNKTIIFEAGVKLKAIIGTFNNPNSCLLEFANCQNITVIGYSAEFRMNKSEYVALNDASEFRHCLSYYNCSGIIVKGLSLYDSGGDGIYIGGETSNNGLGYCQNVFIEDVKCINNYRQGMSIISVQNMTVKNSQFSDTIGTLPEAGIDIEPYLAYQRIVNLNIEKCSFTNNGFSGIAVALVYMNGTSLPVSIIVKDCYFKKNCRPGNIYTNSEIVASADDFNPVQGSVLFERCFIDGSDYAAYYSRKTAAAYTLKFKDCAFQNVSQLQIEYNEPIFLEVPSYNISSPALGGYEFENVLISYPTNFNFFRVLGWPTLQGLSNITGNFKIVEPNNTIPLYTNVAQQTNVSFNFTNQTDLQNNVTLNQIQNTAIECNNTIGSFEISRILTNISYPLGVSYSKSGNTTFGDDVHLMTGGLVIPSNASSITETIEARKDFITEADENLQIAISSNALYVQSLNIANFTIKDCTILNTDDKKLTSLKMYPNPAKDYFFIENTNFENSELTIYDLQGRKVSSQFLTNNETKIETSTLLKGIYIVENQYKNVKYLSKLIIE
jgi:Secretion system C-terminal sorting domain/Right handed beta helix region